MTDTPFPPGDPKADLNWEHPANAKVEIVDRDLGIVKCVPPRRKVAIVGFASSSRNDAPFDDPEWEIWGLNQLNRHIPRADRWFEIHNRKQFTHDIVRDTDYVGWLQSCRIPVYMIERFDDIPNSIRFPLERTHSEFERTVARAAYYQSSIAFMQALAINEGFTTIGIWGVDLVVGEEYGYQKPCTEYWIGVAVGKGIEMVIPEPSALCKGRPGHYGSLVSFEGEGYIKRAMLQKRHNALRERQTGLASEANAIDGAQQLATMLREQCTASTQDDLKAIAWNAVEPIVKSLVEKTSTRREELIREITAIDGAFQENEFWQSRIELKERGAQVDE